MIKVGRAFVKTGRSCALRREAFSALRIPMQLKVPDLSRLADEKIGVISELAVQQRIIFSSRSPRFSLSMSRSLS